MNQRIFLSPPYMFGNEQKLVNEAFASNYIAPCGPMVEAFEKTFAARVGVPHVCALSSCSAALDLLFHDLGVVAGDTVFCSNLTFVASVAAAVHRGATPVFIGSDADTWTISPGLLEEALNDARLSGKMPKAVIAVDLYGQCCDYEAIERLCRGFDVPLVVDAAEALGAVYCGLLQPRSGCNDESKKKGSNSFTLGLAPTEWLQKGVRQAGDAGMAGVYSFNGNKIITSSGGGMLVSRDKGLVQRAYKRAQQSRDTNVWYEHSELGYNYRMSNIVAAIGLGQLHNLDQIVEKKRSIFETYGQLLGGIPGVEFMPEASYGRCNRWLTVLTFHKSCVSGSPAAGAGEPMAAVMKIIKELESENIEARPVWKPMHLQPVFKGCRVYGEKTDEDIFCRGVCLPSGTGLSQGDITRVAEIVRRSL